MNPTSAQLGLNHCNKCGECCRQSTCILEEADVPKIARHLGVMKKKLVRKFLQVYEPSRGRYAVKPRMTATGCVFLKDNLCSIQSVKPKGGREFECWTPQGDGKRYEWTSLAAIGIRVE
jgi:Fe-S-cluster containining protein